MLEDEARRASARAAWKDARALIRRHRGRLAVGMLLLVVSRAAGLVLPASSKILIDDVIGHGRHSLLGPLAAAIVAAALLQGVTSLLLARVLAVAAHRAILDIRRDVHRKVLHLPVSAFDATRSGTWIARIMNDPEGLRNLLGSGLVQIGSSLLTAVLALTVLVYLHWRLTAMTVVLLAAFAGLVVHAFRLLRPLFRQRAEISSQVVGRLNETLGGIRVVKAYRAEEHEGAVFTSGLERLFASVTREVTASAAVGAAALVLFGGISAVLVYFGGREIATGGMTLGDFVMYVFFIGLLVAPLVRLADMGTQLGEAFAGLDRIREVQDQKTDDADDTARASLEALRGDIEFEDVGFEYEPGAPVLAGVSFRAAAGTTTALVGPSGAGKSTVIALAMGFHAPSRGRVRVDGIDLADVKVRDYRRYLGVVLQETFLFDGTVAENIAYARPGASREEVVAAARTAHCHDFVSALEKGYDTVVGERGTKLSGGQRQRVAIARAVLADPRILILDEATSSLDSESEALVQDGLNALRRGRTTFVIAHRLSTVKAADQILVLDAGRVVERGDHETLLAASGRYRALYDRQFQTTTETAPPAAPDPVTAAPEPSIPLLEALLPGSGGHGTRNT